MVPANKILTVAYGTFSCTLEGFDDPFSTMTDIAEYFRDLAAEDRFFGAEPPTPDMAMLRMIAETRAKRSVDAQPEEGGVVLRPSTVPAPEAVSAAFDVASEETVADNPITQPAAAPVADPIVAQDVEPARDDETDPTPALEVDDPIAAEDMMPVAEDIVEDETFDAEEEPAVETRDATEIVEDDEPAQQVATHEDATETAIGEDGAAAKLARIRDVVEAERDVDPTFAEDEFADEMFARDQAHMADDTLTAAFPDDGTASDLAGHDREDTLSADLSAIFATPGDDTHAEEPADAAETDWTEMADASGSEDEGDGADDLASEAGNPVSAWTGEDDEPDAFTAYGHEEGERVDTAPHESHAIADDDPVANDDEAGVAAETDDAIDEVAAFDEADVASEEISAFGQAEAAAADEEIVAADERIGTADEDAAEDDAAEGAVQPRRISVRKILRADAAQAAEAAFAPEEDDFSVEVIGEDPTPTANEIAASGIDEGTEVMATGDEDLMAELAEIETELVREPGDVDKADTTDRSESYDDLIAELIAIRTGDDETDDDAQAEPEYAPDAMTEPDMRDMTDEMSAFDDAPFEEPEAETAEVEALDTEVEAHETEVEAHDPMVDAQDTEVEMQDVEEESVERSEEVEIAQRAAPSGPDMERLFAATDSRLTGEDASRRHANISHLKAAVAAKRAEGSSEEEERDETDPYRADLANTVRPATAVRPRRAARSAEGRAERPARPERPAPLVLVSEQRVEEEPVDAAPIQPRRASHLRRAETREEPTMHDGDAMNGDDFEQFAADVGAVDLPDILEAAAVYSAKVMGQDNFSRPRLLHLAAEACDEMSREDGLRGFGQLLRDGTIRKVSRGTFALASDSRYVPDAERRAG
ncbi:hypothetical protein MWU52_09500 [Jannaschia sp. S6380]|uniref:hypothetical protein n=1 Tax=Jannaschia sp. S6380 TaxID=2926408 RepID=UPI001FF2F2A0|nr:hypothetical protein [Jannaschia sp. S6380]MCK0167780.1 hypothetical protein [Jannaschia sp. S6380]